MSHHSLSLNKIMLLSGLLLLSACAHDPSQRKVKQFSVPDSFLKQQAVEKPIAQQEEEKVKAEAQFRETPISNMARLEMGAPLLSSLPTFKDNNKLVVALNEMPLPQLAHYVFGELLALNYVLSPDVERMSDKVALNLQAEVTPTALFSVTREIMLQQQVEVFTKDDVIYLAKRSNRAGNRSVGIGASLSDMPESGDDILQLVPFIYNSPRSITNIVTKLTNAKVTTDAENRLLLVEGTRADVEKVLQLVGMLDVPSAKGRDIRMLSLVYLSPTELIDSVSKLMEAEGLQVGQDIALVPIARLNSVVVYAGNKVLGDRVASWARTLDTSTGSEEAKYFVYRPQFAKAEDLANSIAMFNKPVTAPAQDKSSSATNSGAGGGAKAAPATSVTSDKLQNALVIHATPSRYKELLKLLEQLDRMPGQVALQVVVAEVTLSDTVESGIEWLYNSTANKPKALTGNLSPATGNLTLNLIDGDWNINLKMLESNSDLRVLSRPYLLVRDGESASINAGDQVPIINSTTSSTQTPGVIQTDVQYRNTGISLSVTPIINAEGLVSLQISQETSAAKASSNIGVTTPTITNRSISTSVLAGNGQTVVLGGLIIDDLSTADQKVPLLGDLPLLGRLFQQSGESAKRTELMVLITPRIIMDSSELTDFGKKLSELYSFPVKP